MRLLAIVGLSTDRFLATQYIVSEDFFILKFRFHFMSQGLIPSHIFTFKLIKYQYIKNTAAAVCLSAPIYSPSQGTRMDFLLPAHNLVIETKRVRDKNHASKVGDELMID